LPNRNSLRTSRRASRNPGSRPGPLVQLLRGSGPPVACPTPCVSDRQNQHALTLTNIGYRERKALKDKAANSGPRAPSLPDRPHSRVVGDHLESSRDLAQKDSAKPCSLCFVPIRRFVQIADRPSVELDSQALAHPQSTFDSSAYLPPSFQLGSSADYLSRAAI
jgi:hypothetical protein